MHLSARRVTYNFAPFKRNFHINPTQMKNDFKFFFERQTLSSTETVFYNFKLFGGILSALHVVYNCFQYFFTYISRQKVFIFVRNMVQHIYTKIDFLNFFSSIPGEYVVRSNKSSQFLPGIPQTKFVRNTMFCCFLGFLRFSNAFPN